MALKSGITSINTVTDTNPKHRTSAFSTLKKLRHKEQKENVRDQVTSHFYSFSSFKGTKHYPRERSQDANIKPALKIQQQRKYHVAVSVMQKETFIFFYLALCGSARDKNRQRDLTPADGICYDVQANGVVIHIFCFSVDCSIL